MGLFLPSLCKHNTDLGDTQDCSKWGRKRTNPPLQKHSPFTVPSILSPNTYDGKKTCKGAWGKKPNRPEREAASPQSRHCSGLQLPWLEPLLSPPDRPKACKKTLGPGLFHFTCNSKISFCVQPIWRIHCETEGLPFTPSAAWQSNTLASLSLLLIHHSSRFTFHK